jgi:hypothetical protein
MKIAINAWSVANGTAFASLFAHLSAAGFNRGGVEFGWENASGHFR